MKISGILTQSFLPHDCNIPGGSFRKLAALSTLLIVIKERFLLQYYDFYARVQKETHEKVNSKLVVEECKIKLIRKSVE